MDAPCSLFSDGPSVFTIPASSGFVEALAKGLHAQFADGQDLSRVTVLLPTRRAGRALADALSRIDGRQQSLLPIIRPLGDVDADDPPFEPGVLSEIIPDAISSERRRFELARLISEKEGALGRPIGVGGALALADSLAQLLDDLATEGVEDLSALNADIRAALPAHMAEAAMFLDIVMQAWPQRLDELQRVDPGKRRSMVLNALCDLWTQKPPKDPVIIAGTTGSIPAVARLIKTVSALDNGAVVLPGFQADMDERAWNAIDDGHPQRAMKSLLTLLKIDRGDVKVWPGTEEGQAAARRTRLIAEALRPAEATSDWLSRIDVLRSSWGSDIVETALNGLAIVEAPSPADEARSIALALRHALEEPEATAILVTPDRGLARRVSVEMKRFGVSVDNSAGISLSDTAVGGFLMRILQAALDPGSALAMLGLVASPLFCLAEDRALLRAEFGRLERAGLRGRRPGRTLTSLLERVQDTAGDDSERATKWGGLMERYIAAMSGFVTLKGEVKAADWARALAEAGEALAESSDKSGAERLWAGDNGAAAAALVREFLEDSEALPALSLREFADAFLQTARGRLVRPTYGANPRVQILGPLEARLVTADRVILAGLNEGVWPAGIKADPFLSRGMRQVAGLGTPELRFGLSAHDFAQLASAPNVLLTRSETQDGAPSVASRWVWRLQTLARGALENANTFLEPETNYLRLARTLDRPQKQNWLSAPVPTPPVDLRPRKLSVTQVETWIRDPYAIFARHILKLQPLDKLDQPAGPAERGTAYHAAIERWSRSLGDTVELNETHFDALVDAGRDALLEAGFSASDMGIEWPRFIRVAAFMIEWEAERRFVGFQPLAIETSGVLAINAPEGPFALSARVDRIDLRPDGALDIIDFKTGTLPGVKEVRCGFAPQLPLQAVMAARGKFENVPGHEPGEMLYLRINGGREPGNERSIVDKPGTEEALDLAEDALDDLSQWIIDFDNPDTAYLSQPRAKFTNRYGDYDHLARRKEWASAQDEAEGNS